MSGPWISGGYDRVVYLRSFAHLGTSSEDEDEDGDNFLPESPS
jgi:hypothetical protein